MARFRTGRVDSITLTRDGIQHLTVDGEPAYALTSVIGQVQVGDAVVMNTTAVELGLGTGGFHVVHWNLSRSRVDLGGSGHIMKGRYLSEQMNIEAWEESKTAKLHRKGDPLPSLAGLTVIVCLLHSHVGLLAAAIRSASRSASTAFVMTDWASLPLPLSNLVHSFSQLGLIDLTAATSRPCRFRRASTPLLAGELTSPSWVLAQVTSEQEQRLASAPSTPSGS